MELGAKESSSLRRTWGSMGGGLQKIKTGAQKLVRSFVNLKTLIMGVIVYKAFGALKRVVASVTDEASKFEESYSKFRVVFKQFADETEEWAVGLAKAVKRSRIDIMGWSASFQDLFVPMGIVRGEAAKLSKDVVKLGIDLASFNNIAEPEVMQRLQSALVGNHETVRKFGVVISETTLKAKMMEMGFQKVNGRFTDQSKILARLQLIIDGTTDAQGDAERTSGSWANTMRGLSAMWRELQVSLGLFIIESPAVRNMLGGIVEKLQSMVTWLDNNRDMLENKLAPAFEKIGSVFERAWGSIIKIIEDRTFELSILKKLKLLNEMRQLWVSTVGLAEKIKQPFTKLGMAKGTVERAEEWLDELRRAEKAGEEVATWRYRPVGEGPMPTTIEEAGRVLREELRKYEEIRRRHPEQEPVYVGEELERLQKAAGEYEARIREIESGEPTYEARLKRYGELKRRDEVLGTLKIVLDPKATSGEIADAIMPRLSEIFQENTSLIIRKGESDLVTKKATQNALVPTF